MKFYYYVIFEVTIIFKDENEEELIIRGDGEFELPDPIKSINEINKIKDKISKLILPDMLENYNVKEYDIQDCQIILDNFIFLRSEQYLRMD